MGDHHGLSAETAIENTKYAAKLMPFPAVIVLIAIYIPMPFTWAASLLSIAGVIAGLMLIVGAWLFVFHGCTAISASLEGPARRWFQVAVSAVVPVLLGLANLFFVKDVSSISLQDAARQLVGVDALAGLMVIALISWFAADELDRKHPFRGFLVASAGLLCVCVVLLVQQGALAQALETGRFVVYFLALVAASYAAMLARLLLP